MDISLGRRTAETVKAYFKAAQNPTVKKYLPQKAKTAEEALADYEQTLLPNAKSYGRTVWADGRHIGDVWCYCIDMEETPNAMVSFCVFDADYWGKGVMTEALGLFLDEISDRYGLKTVGAFTYLENAASVRVLEKCGFTLREEIDEDGVTSGYFQLDVNENKENVTELSQLFKSIVDQDRCAVVICNLQHKIVYMNPAAAERYAKRGGAELTGRSLLDCHNKKSCEMIERVIGWFKESSEHNIIYTFRNEKENKDVYMVALRNEGGALIGYYEKHEYRNTEAMELYRFWESRDNER